MTASADGAGQIPSSFRGGLPWSPRSLREVCGGAARGNTWVLGTGRSSNLPGPYRYGYRQGREAGGTVTDDLPGTRSNIGDLGMLRLPEFGYEIQYEPCESCQCVPTGEHSLPRPRIAAAVRTARACIMSRNRHMLDTAGMNKFGGRASATRSPSRATATTCCHGRVEGAVW